MKQYLKMHFHIIMIWSCKKNDKINGEIILKKLEIEVHALFPIISSCFFIVNLLIEMIKVILIDYYSIVSIFMTIPYFSKPSATSASAKTNNANNPPPWTPISSNNPNKS